MSTYRAYSVAIPAEHAKSMNREAIAYRIAGAIIAAVEQGGESITGTIEPDWHGDGHLSCKLPATPSVNRAVVLLSGPEAVAKFTDTTFDLRDPEHAALTAEFYAMSEATIDPRFFRRHAIAITEKLVARQWALIESTAETLLKQGTIVADVIRR